MGTNKNKAAHAEYKREWRLKTGRTKRVGRYNVNAKLTNKDHKKILKLKGQGHSNIKIAATLNVSEGAIRKALKRLALLQQKN